MTKVLIMGLTPPLEGGSERHVYEVSSRLDNCKVFTQGGSDCKNSIGVPLIKGPAFLRNILFFIMSLIYSLWLVIWPWRKYDVVHIHENLLYVLAPLLSLRYKVFVTVHGITGFKFYDNKILWFIFGNSLRFCHTVISVDCVETRLLRKVSKNVVYISNGVDIDLYRKIKKGKIEKKITFLGRVHKQKGLLYLLEAFGQISKKFKDYKLEIIGRPEGSYYEMLVKRFNNPNIIWRGFVSDRKEIFSSLASSEILVYPSLWEALPWPAMLEGLGSGRPVIASDLDGMREVFKDEEEILLVKSKDVKGIVKAIEKLLKDKKLGYKIGKNGEKKAKEFSWDAIAEKTGRAYGNC